MSHHAPMCANPGTAPSVVNPGRASYPKAEFLQSHSTCPSNVCHVDRRRGHRMSELPGLHCPHAMCRGFFTHIVSCACTDVAQLSVSAIPYIYPTYTLHIPYMFPILVAHHPNAMYGISIRCPCQSFGVMLRCGETGRTGPTTFHTVDIMSFTSSRNNVILTRLLR